MAKINSIDHGTNIHDLVRAIRKIITKTHPNAGPIEHANLCVYALAALATGATETPAFMRIHVRAHIVQLCAEGAAIGAAPK